MPHVRFHTEKHQSSDAATTFCTEFNNIAGHYPIVIAKDLGREFASFVKWTTDRGIQIRDSAPRAPEPNGPIERLQFYVVQIGLVMTIDAGLPTYLWPYALDTAVYIISRPVRQGQTKSPIQQWREALKPFNPKQSLQHL